MQFYFLSPHFFSTYPHAIYPEFECKLGRPYTIMIVKYNGTDVALPLRSNVNHSHKFPTIGNKGLDYTKSVFLVDPNFVDRASNPSVDNHELTVLYGKESDIVRKYLSYVNEYINAFNFMLSCTDYSHKRYHRSYKIVSYSTLHYYHGFLNLTPYDPNSFSLPV